MNQRKLALAIAKRFFLTQRESRKVIKFILAQATESLKEGERISLYRFGSFIKKKRAPRKVRHPETGKTITIPGKITVEFNSSKLLLRKLK